MISRRHFWKKLLLVGLFTLHAGPVYSGVVLDGTLGTRGRLSGPYYDILSRFGRIVGSNLFHSFLNFDIGTGETAAFSGPASIANIIARVTGGDASDIDGLLRSNISGANLFLINPNGIVFGQNASLDISGSFYASTADYLRLGSSGRFDVTDPSASVLTSDPPAAFGFLSATPAGIDIRNSRLAVNPGKSLNFIAGNLTISGDGTAPTLSAQGGAINLLAGGNGEVAIGSGRPVNNLGTAGDITITGDGLGNFPQIDVSNPTGAGGRVYISGGRFLLDNAWIASDSNGAQQGGGIVIEGSEVTLDSGYLTTSTSGDGNAGNILIDAASIHIGGDSQIGSWAADPASGNAGNITLRATGNILVDGRAWIYNDTYGDGNAGNILIDGGSVHIGELATVSSNSADETDIFANGDAGDITIRGTGQVLIDGDAWIQSEAFDEGDAGNITIRAGTFSLLEGGKISSYTNYHGNAGNILVAANSIHVGDGAYIKAGALDDIWGLGVTGNAGNITLVGRDAVVIDGSAFLRSDTQGSGNAGDITINAGSLHIGEDSQVSSSAAFFSTGHAGNISLNASGGVLIDGAASISSETWGAGNAGNIAINADSIHIGGDSKVSSSAFISSAGNAGNITLNADGLVLIDGIATVSSEAWLAGNAGDIVIDAGSIHLGGDSWVSSSAFGAGNAGNISLNADNDVLVDGNAWVSSEAWLSGNAGDIAIDAGSIHIGGDSWVSSSAYASANAGNITLRADGQVLIDGTAWVESESWGDDDAGNISIEAGSIHIGGDSMITSSTLGGGNAGTITLRAGNGVLIDGTAWVFSETYDSGEAGDILIAADSIHIGGDSWVSTSSRAAGNAGSIVLNASDELLINGTAWVESEAHGTGHAGSIVLRADDFSLQDGAHVSTSTTAAGNAGSILIDVDGLTEIDGGTISSSTSGTGVGGSISVHSGSLILSDSGRLAATSTGIGSGTAGSITVDIDDSLIMTSGGSIETSTEDADGGDIQVTVGELLWMRDSSITTSVRGGMGNGGNIILEGGAMVLDDSSITANAYGGNGGNITITADPLLIDEDSVITASSQLGVQGTIGINAPLVDVGGSLVNLPEGMLTDDLSPKTCSTVGDNSSSFVVRNGLPAKRHDDSLSF